MQLVAVRQLLWVLITIFAATAPATAQRRNERAAIEQCVQHYYDASNSSAPDELAKTT
jgi:hypothetical protein